MTGFDTDRRVHAECERFAIVRYNRAGKWYIEFFASGKRQRIGVVDAAQRAYAAETLGGTVYSGLPGGQTFDRWVAVERAR